MPVTTVSSDQVVRGANGRPTIVTNQYTNSSNRSSRYYSNRYRCRAKQLTPRLDLVKPGSPVALDCEGMMLFGDEFKDWRSHGVGRCSIVNVDGQVVYDTFVYYSDDVNHRPSPQWLKLGVKHKDILPKYGAQPHAQVLAAAKAVFDKSGIVVAHAAINDERMLCPLDFSPYRSKNTRVSRTLRPRGICSSYTTTRTKLAATPLASLLTPASRPS